MVSDAVGAILLTAVTLYALFGGADFGGGLWDLLAGTTRRGRAPRALIDQSIGPVWEANHVWLIFNIVVFWTAFPIAFSAVMSVCALPIWLAVGGIVLRGAGFAFRKEVSRLSLQRMAGATFALSSLITPFFMGTVIGAIATGRVPADGTHANIDAWTNSTSLLLGCLFVAACAYLAATYLVGEAAPREDWGLCTYFTRRAQGAALVAGALSLAALASLRGSNRALYDRLTGRALALVVLAGVCGLVVVALLTAGRREGVRIIAALGVAAVIWGWGVAQYPTLLPGTSLTLSNAGAPHASLVAIVVVSIVAVVLLGPSFVLLFTLQSHRVLVDADQRPISPERQGTNAGRSTWAADNPGALAVATRDRPNRLVTALAVVAVRAYVRLRRRN
jgi:cytochrome bd ubiquinol oxidase subunit II